MDHRFIRVDLGEEHDRQKMMDLFRKKLREENLLSDSYLYHAFDGAELLDNVTMTGCDAKDPQHYSCGIARALTNRRSGLYNPLETGMMLGKPGLLVYKRRSLVCVSESESLYRFRGTNYFRGLIAILLAKRPKIRLWSELALDL